MSQDSFNTRQSLRVGNDAVQVSSLEALEASGYSNVGRLPYSLKILLENMLRREDGRFVTRDDIDGLARWTPGTEREIAFIAGTGPPTGFHRCPGGR